MWQKHAVGLAVAGIITATNAHALGLGEIKVISALNEPLSAEVNLLQVKQLNALQIHPRMADVNDYALAGLERPYFLSGIRFQVKVQPDGSGKIIITSDQPMREPFLNFLMEVNWPNGRLVREYTLLLDPPVFEPAPVKQQVSPAASTTAVPEKKPVRAEAVTPPASQASRVTTSAPTADSPAAAPTVTNNDVRVGRKDTLWALAINNKPAGISPQQLMIAWLKKNPDAFIDGNINRLKANAILKMPSAEEFASVTPAQAAEEVTRQTQMWQSKRAKPAPQKVASQSAPEEPATPEPEEKPAASRPEPEIASDDAELKVVAPEEPAEGVAQADDAESDAAASAAEAAAEDPLAVLQTQNQDLEQRLNDSLEAADQTARENEALNERLDAIQQQLESLQRMLELKDQELASLQSEFAKAQAEPKSESNLLEQLMASPMVLIGLAAGLVILLLGALFALRKRKPEDGADSDAVVPATAAVAGAAVAAEAEPAAELESETAVEEVAAAVAVEEAAEEVTETEQVELPIVDEEDTDLSEFDDLDLDMDLDLEDDEAGRVLGTLQEDTDNGEVLLEDEEFDLALPEADENDEDDSAAVEGTAEIEESDISSDLDDILGETPEPEPEAEPEIDLSSDLDDILGDVESAPAVEEELSLDEVLTESDQVEALADAEELDELLQMPEQPSDSVVEEETLAVDDDLEFDLGDLTPPEAETETETEATPAPVAESSVSVAEDDLEFDLSDIPETPEEISVPEEESAEDGLDFDLDLDLDIPTDAPTQTADEPVAAMADDLDLDLDLDDIQSEPEAEPEAAAALESAAEKPAEQAFSEELDSELDELLGATDNDIELEESGADDQDEDFDALAGLNLLEGADEVETKLDLARAYMDMEDLEGAKDILQEILSEGNASQKQEAEALMNTLNES
ncbi:FimV/HubP family polar landmark protein [Pontibacter sp. JAM-7]|uniref:FimV/HubP family polar landmark protein n=1 Tax=Pontibacter sp. JAM-7 TaxID=3366581 RepID=UPI003AF95113